MTPYVRRAFAGGAVTTTLAANIGSTDLTFSVASATGWPGSSPVGNFYVVVDRGTTAEEKILCSSNTGTTVSVATGGRGSDGTSGASHNAGATVSVCIAAQDADEANQVVVNTLGMITTKGDLLTAATATTMQRVGVGSTGQYLGVNAGLPAWTSPDGTAGDIASIALASAAGAVGKLPDAGHVHGTPLTTKGDLLVTDGAALHRLAVGSDGQFLVARSSAANGVEWETAPYFLAYATGTTSFNAHTWTQVAMAGTEASGGSPAMTLSSSEVTVARAGLHHVSWGTAIEATVPVASALAKNGTDSAHIVRYGSVANLSGGSNLSDAFSTGSCLIVLAANDYLTVLGFIAEASGTGLTNDVSSSATNFLHVVYVGPA